MFLSLWNKATEGGTLSDVCYRLLKSGKKVKLLKYLAVNCTMENYTVIVVVAQETHSRGLNI